MSNNIEIFPVETVDITFGQVLELSQKNIDAFLKAKGINKKVELEVNLYRDNGVKLPLNLSDKFEWKEEEDYVIFSIKDVNAVAETYIETISEIDYTGNYWWKLEDIEKSDKFNDLDYKIQKIKQLNRMWYIRCHWANPIIMYVSYGLICAAIAELTSGFLHTYDDVWEDDSFPTESKEFLERYYREEKTTDPEFIERAKKSLTYIKEELQHLPDKPL